MAAAANAAADAKERWSQGHLARLVASAKNLQVIDLKDNTLVSIPGEVTLSFTNARVLDLRKNKFAQLPEELGQCKTLEDLYLDQNVLTRLPDSLGQLTNLRTLCASQNHLVTLPSSLCQLTKLRTLHLGDNRLTSLPDVSQLRELRALFIHHNHFTALPTGMPNLTNLQECALEWFRYASPALPRVVKGPEGVPILEKLRQLSEKMKRGLTFVEVVKHFSAGEMSLHTLDFKKRSRLHIAALEGHAGVAIALLEAKVNPEPLDVDSYSPLLVAVREEHADIVRVLVERHADVNGGGGLFGSPLHVATAAFDESAVRLLVNAKADTNRADVDGNSPLHVLMSVFDKGSKWSVAIGDILLERGANPNALNSDGWAPLHLASRRGQVGALHFAFAHNAKAGDGKAFDLNLRGGSHWWTCLHLSGHACHVGIVQLLLEAGAEVFIRNIDGRTARHVSRGNLAISKMVRKAEEEWLWYRVHADRGTNGAANGHASFAPPARVSKGSEDGRGVSAIQRKCLETQLIPAEFAHLAQTNFNQPVKEFFPFFKQILSESAYRVQVLMRQPWALAKMVSDERDEEGNSVFLLLAAAGDEDAVRSLAVRFTAEQRAAVAKLENSAKETVLHAIAKPAERTGGGTGSPYRADLASFLLAVCPSLRLEAKDQRGFTALHWAALKGDLALVQVLLCATADANAHEQTTGWTPLHCAVSEGHSDIVQQLVHSDADVDAADNFEWTPLYEAASKLDTVCTGLLVAGGATLTAPVNEHGFDVVRAIDTSKKDLAAKRWFTCLVVANGADPSGFRGVSKQDDENLEIARKHFETQHARRGADVPPFYVPAFLAPRCMECKVLFAGSGGSAQRATCRASGISICTSCVIEFQTSVKVLDAVERPRSDRLSAAIELSLQRGGAGAAGDQRTVQVPTRTILISPACLRFFQHAIGETYTQY